jgi:hypothetical protein
MTDTENYEEAASEAADEARDDRAHKWITGLLIAAVAGVLVLAATFGVWVTTLQQQVGHLIATGNDSATQSQKLADQVKGLGATPVVQPAVPAPSGPTIVSVPVPIPGPGPTQAQIDDAVTAYLAVHPPAAGKSASPAMVATAVAEFLTANPPMPGRPPTPQEIATAASTWFTTHASEFQGPAGKNVTDAQVTAAVDAYCTAHGCAGKAGTTGPTGPTGGTGPTGPQGPQGVSFTDLQFHRDGSGTCRAIAYFHDPATGKDSSITHSAGDAACPVSAPSPLIPTR